jgi:hypothetical protein
MLEIGFAYFRKKGCACQSPRGKEAGHTGLRQMEMLMLINRADG